MSTHLTHQQIKYPRACLHLLHLGQLPNTDTERGMPLALSLGFCCIVSAGSKPLKNNRRCGSSGLMRKHILLPVEREHTTGTIESTCKHVLSDVGCTSIIVKSHCRFILLRN
jgi:hypothetical protein